MPSSSLANLCTTAVSPSARSTCRLPTSIPTYTVSELSTVFSFYRGRLRLRSLLQTRAQRRPKQLFERIPEAPNLATRLPDGLLAQEVIGQPDPALGPLLIPQTQRTRGRRGRGARRERGAGRRRLNCAPRTPLSRRADAPTSPRGRGEVKRERERAMRSHSVSLPAAGARAMRSHSVPRPACGERPPGPQGPAGEGTRG